MTVQQDVIDQVTQTPPAAATAPAASARIGASLVKRAELVSGAVLVGIAVLMAIVVPLVNPGGSTALDASNALASPSWSHLLGTDELGRDLFTRVAAGYQITLTVSVGAVLLAVILGGVMGLLAATSVPFVDGLIMRVLDVVMAFPALLLAIVVVALFGAGTVVLLFAIGIVFVPIMARVTRAAALETSKQAYVEAARARGAGGFRILFRHIAPNSVGPVIVQASILMAVSIMLEASLSFVGLGVQPPTPSLGLMLSNGRDFMSSDPWVVAAPALAILVVVLGFTLIGDGLQTWLDPKKRVMGR